MKSLDEILAENLNALMRDHALGSNEKVAAASGLGTGTIQRSRHAESSATLKTIESLSRAFRISPSLLVQENLGRSVATQNDVPLLSPSGQRLIDRLTQLDARRASPPALYALIENALDLVHPVASGDDYASFNDL